VEGSCGGSDFNTLKLHNLRQKRIESERRKTHTRFENRGKSSSRFSKSNRIRRESERRATQGQDTFLLWENRTSRKSRGNIWARAIGRGKTASALEGCKSPHNEDTRTKRFVVDYQQGPLWSKGPSVMPRTFKMLSAEQTRKEGSMTQSLSFPPRLRTFPMFRPSAHLSRTCNELTKRTIRDP